ncbi:MAG: Mrp/NBP35 family ATP-binding protein [Fidelibacterota bacterium]|nr:MAG: Mrp/NBP35 family ATP-binding protein [Candidatus Neomarinimicrobiota bacterium]
MKRDDIMAVLKTVNYPGYSRDIISFGMVTDVQISGSDVKVVLAVATSNQEQKAQLAASIKSALSERLKLSHVEVETVTPKPAANAGAFAAAGPNLVRTAIPGVERTIAVASSKGGVGKSTVAVNLAAAMSLAGANVGILDLDIYGPSLPMMVGIDERPSLNDQQKIVPLKRHGLRIMSFGFISGNQAPTIWRGPLVAKLTEQFFEDVDWGELDYLILDLPPGTGDIQLTMVQRLILTGVVIVTTPQKLALLDVRKGADMFKKVDTPVLGVVENMSGLSLTGVVKDAGRRAVPEAILELEGLSEVSRITADKQGYFEATLPIFRSGGGNQESNRLGVPLLGRIPLASDLVIASDSGEPYVLSHPDTPVGKAFKHIADTLMKQTDSPEDRKYGA